MPDINHKLEPVFTSVAEAATYLNVKTARMYALLDQGAIESRYEGTRRKVVIASLREYAANLPTVHPDAR